MNIKKLAVLAVCLAGAYQAYHYFVGDRAELTLRNGSDVGVRTVSVTVDGDTQDFYNIAPGQTAEGSFRVGADSFYRVACVFADGANVSQDVGFLMHGRGSKDTITLERHAVLIGAPGP